MNDLLYFLAIIFVLLFCPVWILAVVVLVWLLKQSGTI
jgi:hypothetical protein